jgi:plasmid stabilization system protein ParE
MQGILFHIEAEAEVDTAFDWYWQQSPNAAVGFLDELAQVQLQIRRNPRMFPHATPTLRKAVLQRYPYYLLFRDIAGGIQVLVVAHAKRKPGYWKGRE